MSSLIHKNEKGIVLVTGLIFMAIIAVVGATAVMLTTTDIKVATNYRDGEQAFYAAEAGINVAMSNIENYIFGGTDTLSTSAPVRVDPASSSYTATYAYTGDKMPGPLKPKAGHEAGAWVGVGFDLTALGESGIAQNPLNPSQSEIQMLARATVPIEAYTGGK